MRCNRKKQQHLYYIPNKSPTNRIATALSKMLHGQKYVDTTCFGFLSLLELIWCFIIIWCVCLLMYTSICSCFFQVYTCVFVILVYGTVVHPPFCVNTSIPSFEIRCSLLQLYNIQMIPLSGDWLYPSGG